MQRIALVHEAAVMMVPGLERFAVQAARRLVRLQMRRGKLRRELRAIDDELKIAKRQLRDLTRPHADRDAVDTPMPKVESA